MTRLTAVAQPAGFAAGWGRWLALRLVGALAGIGLLPLHPSPAVAAVAAALAVASAALLLAHRRPPLVSAVAAPAAIAVLGYGTSSNVGWFAVCLVAAWCALVARRSQDDLGAVLAMPPSFSAAPIRQGDCDGRGA